MNVQNKTNEYAAALGDLFDRTPKAVLAAIAVSVCTQGGDFLDEAAGRLLHEWDVLHANGIVPQKPPKHGERIDPWVSE